MRSGSPLQKFLHWEKEIADRVFLQQPFNGEWKTWTYQEAGAEIRKVASGLRALNLPERSNVALLSKNCAHWIMADLAIMMAGHISVPLYPTLTAPSIQQILEHSEAKAVIIGKLDKYSEQRKGVPANVITIGVEQYAVRETYAWETFVQQQQPLTTLASWSTDELFTIMYTSGTTGKPKGVMHSTGAFDAVVETALKDLSIPQHPKLFSYLPLSHIAERMGVEMVGIYTGALFSFAESLDTFPKNLADTQPNIFFAVPRLWAKFREKISEKLPEKKLNTLLAIPIVNTIVRNSIKKKLGLSKATHIYSGAAPITVEMLEWFDNIGVHIFQAIGMSEDCIYSHFNRHGANKFGSVGQALSGVSVKIADDGELRLKSPSNMKGYYKDPELSAAAFDEEGYLKTGDQVERDAQGFVTVVGRIKDQFKTDKGKYVSPGPIEMLIMSNSDIEQACVVGMGIPQPIALILLSASGKAKTKHDIIHGLSAVLTKINATLESYEKIEKMVILQEDWTIENGLLTPTLKVKRNEVEKIHLQKYPAWYALEGKVVWE